MPTYYVNEAVFTLPERSFVDRTLHRLESPLPGDDPLAIEVRRVRMDRDDTSFLLGSVFGELGRVSP